MSARGGGGSRGKGHIRTWGRGVKQGRTSTFGKIIEVQNCLVVEKLYREKSFMLAKKILGAYGS